LGCEVVGLDRSPGALTHARRRRIPGVRFVLGDATRLPFGPGRFEAALVLDSLASILDPAMLLGELGRVLAPGGRLGCTVEVGEPLDRAELGRIEPGVEACVLPLDRWLGLLDRAGFQVHQADDDTRHKAAVARRLVGGLARDRAALGEELGGEAVGNLTKTLSAWGDFLTRGRLRAITIVAERRPTQRAARAGHRVARIDGVEVAELQAARGRA
jgi:SAM-dependent methyltransferase